MEHCDQVNVVVEGPGYVGKSALTVRYVCGIYHEHMDPTVMDTYRKFIDVEGSKCQLEVTDTANVSHPGEIDQYTRRAHWFFLLAHMDEPELTHEKDREHLIFVADRIRRLRSLAPTDPLPAFLVGTKCDQPIDLHRRSKLLSLAASIRVLGYYETSARYALNLEPLFHDAVLQVRMMRNPALHAQAKAELAKIAGINGALPWNWGKLAKWNAQLRRLEHAPKTLSLAATTHSGISSEDIAKFRFPEPTLQRNPVAFYKDLRQLLEDKRGLDLSDVAVVATEGGGAIRAHRVVLFIRSEYFRAAIRQSQSSPISVPGIQPRILQHVINFLYTDQLPMELAGEDLDSVGHLFGIPALCVDAEARVRSKIARGLANSEVVQKLTKPWMGSDELKSLSVAGSKQVFRLHRAILWSRSEWFRALLDRWTVPQVPTSADAKLAPIEITTMSPDTFACVTEFLYTGRVEIPEELAMDVLVAGDMLSLPRLVQLAEIALQPVIDAGNAVAVYLAAQAHGAKQLAAVCLYWMAVDLEAAKEHEQWEEISADVKAKVMQEADRLTEEKKRKRVEKEMLEKLPCMLSPSLPYRPEKPLP